MWFLYYLTGGLRFDRILRKTPHKKEHETQIKKDYTSYCCLSALIANMVLFLVFFLLWLLSRKLTENSAIIGILLAITCAFWYIVLLAISDGRKAKRNEIISNICENCLEYGKWQRGEKLVDVDHEIENEVINTSVDIKGKRGTVIGTIEIPQVLSTMIRKETYYVSRKCNCCGQVYYHYETRRK